MGTPIIINEEQLEEFRKLLHQAQEEQSTYKFANVIKACFKEIFLARKKLKSWEEIAGMLKMATGQEINPETVKNYYYKIAAEKRRKRSKLEGRSTSPIQIQRRTAPHLELPSQSEAGISARPPAQASSFNFNRARPKP